MKWQDLITIWKYWKHYIYNYSLFWNLFSTLQIMSYEELCVMLGVTEHILQGCDVRVKFKNDDELILSPSRKKRKYDK